MHDASSNLPGPRRGGASATPKRSAGPYSVLLQAGLAVPPSLRSGRWALTPPFHPCRTGVRRFDFCGAVPEPANRPAGISPAPCLHGARTFLSCRVSPLAAAAARPSDASSHHEKGRRGQARRPVFCDCEACNQRMDNSTSRPSSPTVSAASRKRGGPKFIGGSLEIVTGSAGMPKAMVRISPSPSGSRQTCTAH